MKRRHPIREPVRILFHLNEGYTRVLFERLAENGLAGGGELDIPTEIIPPRLRAIGSRFILVGPAFSPEPADSADDIRAAIKCHIEEIRPL